MLQIYYYIFFIRVNIYLSTPKINNWILIKRHNIIRLWERFLEKADDKFFKIIDLFLVLYDLFEWILATKKFYWNFFIINYTFKNNYNTAKLSRVIFFFFKYQYINFVYFFLKKFTFEFDFFIVLSSLNRKIDDERLSELQECGINRYLFLASFDLFGCIHFFLFYLRYFKLHISAVYKLVVSKYKTYFLKNEIKWLYSDDYFGDDLPTDPQLIIEDCDCDDEEEDIVVTKKRLIGIVYNFIITLTPYKYFFKNVTHSNF